MEYPKGKLNLLKFRNACVVSVGNEQKKGIFIPIEDNSVYISNGRDGRVKGAYVDFMVFKNPKPVYGFGYTIRQCITEKTRCIMTEEERKTIPYLGNMNIPEDNVRTYSGNRPADKSHEDYNQRQNNKRPAENAKVSMSMDEEDNLPF